MGMMDGSGSTETNRTAGGGLAEIGAMLRKRREEVGQELADISAVTHIKPMFLKAISTSAPSRSKSRPPRSPRCRPIR
jgi:hypothetical protein